MTTIHYTTRTEDVDTGRVTRTNESYTPTLKHAREWAKQTDKFAYTLDMLGMSLSEDGGNAERAVDRVEDVYMDIISSDVFQKRLEPGINEYAIGRDGRITLSESASNV
tara:strand:- start:140 stop:466 length:327 start_codon:yes stop_codon:yes gene_type:complete